MPSGSFWQTRAGTILNIWQQALSNIAKYNHYNYGSTFEPDGSGAGKGFSWSSLGNTALSKMSGVAINQNWDAQQIGAALFQANLWLESAGITDFEFSVSDLVASGKGPESLSDFVNLMSPDFLPDDLAVRWQALIEEGLAEIGAGDSISVNVVDAYKDYLSIEGDPLTIQQAGLGQSDFLTITLLEATSGGSNYLGVYIPSQDGSGLSPGLGGREYLPELSDEVLSDTDLTAIALIDAYFIGGGHPGDKSYLWDTTDAIGDDIKLIPFEGEVLEVRTSSLSGTTTRVWGYSEGRPVVNSISKYYKDADGLSSTSVEIDLNGDGTWNVRVTKLFYDENGIPTDIETANETVVPGEAARPENVVRRLLIKSHLADTTEIDLEGLPLSMPFMLTGLTLSDGVQSNDYSVDVSAWAELAKLQAGALLLQGLNGILQSDAQILNHLSDNPALLEAVAAAGDDTVAVYVDGDVAYWEVTDENGNVSKVEVLGNGNIVRVTRSTGAGVSVSITTYPDGSEDYNATLFGTEVSIGQVAQVFGSTLGRQLGGNSTVGQIVAGTLIGEVAESLANAIGAAMDPQVDIGEAVADAFENFDEQLGGAALGAVSSYIAAELVDVLGIDGVAGDAANIVGGVLVGDLASNLAAGKGLVFSSSVDIGASIGNAFAGYLNSKIVNSIISFDSIQGQIGAQIGSTVVQFFVPGLVGAFLGHTLGGAIGSIFAGTPESGVHVYWDDVSGQFKTLGDNASYGSDVAGDPYKNWADDDGPDLPDQDGSHSELVARHMAESATDILNSMLSTITATGGELLNGSVITGSAWGQHDTSDGTPTYRYWYDGENSHKKGDTASDNLQANFDKTTEFEEALGQGIGYNLSQMAIIGGDLLLRRAFYGNVGTFDLAHASEYDPGSILGDLVTAADFAMSQTPENQFIIDFLRGAQTGSGFSYGWAGTDVRAWELGLDAEFAISDFLGGLQSMLPFYRTSSGALIMGGKTYSDVTLALNGADLEITVGVATAPIVITDFAARMGYNDGSSTVYSDIRVATGTTGVEYTDAATTGPDGAPFTQTAGQNTATRDDDTYTKSTTSDDIFVGADGDDTLSGGYGWDWLDGGAGDDKIDGGDGRDVLLGRDGADTLTGDAGDDTIAGGAGADKISAGAGDDLILIDQDGTDADTIDGGAGTDTASYEDFTVGVNASLVTAALGDSFTNIENLTGSRFDDTVTGNGSANLLSGLTGDDTIAGGGGKDTLMGGAGADALDGGAGVDTASYANAAYGVTAYLSDPTQNTGDAEGDSYTGIENLLGSAFGDQLKGDGNQNTLEGGAGDDILVSSGGGDRLDGGDGADVVDYSSSSAAVTVDLQTRVGSGGHAEGDTYLNIEGVIGSDLGDVLIAAKDGSMLSGGAGDDTLTGDEGADAFVLNLGSGDDVFTSGGGTDIIRLGAGIDFGNFSIYAPANMTGFSVSAGTDSLTYDLAEGQTTGRFAGISQIVFDNGNYVNVAGLYQYVDLGAGNDVVEKPAGNQAAAIPLVGTSGDDSLKAPSHTAGLWYDGGSGNDLITGMDSNDIFMGGTGDDTLIGGFGDDQYIVRRGDGTTTISDEFGRNDTLILDAGITVDDLLFRWTTDSNNRRVMEIGIKSETHDPDLEDWGQITDFVRIESWTNAMEAGRVEWLMVEGSRINLSNLARQHVSNAAPLGANGMPIDIDVDFRADLSGTPIGSPVAADADGDRVRYSVLSVTGDVIPPAAGGGNASFWIENGHIMTDAVMNTTDPITVTLEIQAHDGIDSSTFDLNVNFDPNLTTVEGNLYKWPVVLDLDGDGVELISADTSTVAFDIDNDGDLDITGWFGPDDGVLALDGSADRPADGIINDGLEISFAQYDTTGKQNDSDIDGLRYFDSNGNGNLDEGDTRYGEFVIWQDRNSNGITDAGELRSLADWGITSISLNIDKTELTVENQNDNTVGGYVTFTRLDGSEGVAADVAFFYGESRKSYYLSGDEGYFRGTNAGENIFGSVYDDRINARAGDDYVFGDSGDDIISADDAIFELRDIDGDGELERVFVSEGHGSDTVYGGPGQDRISGISGENYLFGDDDADTIQGGSSKDYIDGGAGNDVLWATGAIDTLYGGEGDDVLYLNKGRGYGGVGDDTLTAYKGSANFMTGGAGLDVFAATTRPFSMSIEDFEDGFDLIDLSAFDKSFSDLIITQNGDHTAISFGGEFDIVVKNTDASVFDASDFIMDRKGAKLWVEALVTNDTTPTLSGTVDDVHHVSVLVTVNGETVEAQIDENGYWTAQLANELADGSYEIHLAATDEFGNESELTLVDALTVDTVAPVVTYEVHHTNDETPILTGSLDDATAEVRVVIGETEYYAVPSVQGTWSLQVPDVLAEGWYDITVEATDPADNVSTVVLADGLDVDFTAPTGTLNRLETGDASPTLTGTVDDPTATITVRLHKDDTATMPVYEAVNNGDGTWTLDVPDELGHGRYDVDVVFSDRAGNRTQAVSGTSRIEAAFYDQLPFEGVFNDEHPWLTFGDIDGDGDEDAFVGRTDHGTVELLRNSGVSFLRRASSSTNPLYGDPWTSTPKPTLVDIDNDGDLDAFVVNPGGNGTKFFENQGTSTDAVYVLNGTLGLKGGYTTLTFGDVDGDGDLDALMGSTTEAPFYYFQNNGTPENPSFSEVTGAENPFGGLNVERYAVPAFIDHDGDGDLDLFAGAKDGTYHYFENIGSASQPNYVERTGDQNPLDGVDVGVNAGISFGDIDGDGDRDLVLTNRNTNGTQVDVYFSHNDQLVVDRIGPSVSLDNLATNDTSPLLTGRVSDPEALVQVAIGSSSYAAVNHGDGTWSLQWPDILPEGGHRPVVSAVDNYGNETTTGGYTDGFVIADSSTDPFDGLNVRGTRTAFVDIDGDGDLDLFVGKTASDGAGRPLYFYRNDGTASSPVFVEVTGSENPLEFLSNSWNIPSFADLDGDGDYDLVLGTQSQIQVYINEGTATDANFVQTTKLGLQDGEYHPNPVLVDIDSDGDIDSFIGGQNGEVGFYLNVGGSTAPYFEHRDRAGGGLASEVIVAKAFADIDGDGDQDAFLVDGGFIRMFENTGSPDAAVFTEVTGALNPFDGYDFRSMGDYKSDVASLKIVDLDDDGVLDAVVTRKDGATYMLWGQQTDKLLVGNQPPTVTVLAQQTTDRTPTISGTVSDPNATVSVEVNGVVRSADVLLDGTWSVAPQPLSDGTYTVTVTATDQAGNSADYVYAAALEVDLTPPVVTVHELEAQDVQPTVTGTVDDAEATIEVIVDGVSYAGVNNGDGTWSAAITDDLAVGGSYSVRAVATSAAGLVGYSVNSAGYVELEGADNIFDAFDVGSKATPVFADVDGDGLLDMMIGDNNGTFAYRRNEGTATNPIFNATGVGGGPFSWLNTGSRVTAAFVDIDGDDDLDAFIGQEDGTIVFLADDDEGMAFHNHASTNPFAAVDVGKNAAPAFADIDHDGDMDAFVGNKDGFIKYFENTGDALNPVFVERTGTSNPFDGVKLGTSSIGNNSNLFLVDFDGDGDLDAWGGDNDGILHYFENVGSREAPDFVERFGADNPLDGIDVGGAAYITLADLDTDGDLEIIVGVTNGTLDLFESVDAINLTISANAAPVITVDSLHTVDPMPTVTGTVSDPAATIEVVVAGKTYAATNNGDGTWSASVDVGLADGVYDVAASATDTFGKTGTDGTAGELIIGAGLTNADVEVLIDQTVSVSDVIVDAGGLTFVYDSPGSSNRGGVPVTDAVSSGKWYWEITVGSQVGNNVWLPIIAPATSDWSASTDTLSYQADVYMYKQSGIISKGHGGTRTKTFVGSLPTFNTGDTIGIAYDADLGALWVNVNGTWVGGATDAQIAAGNTSNATLTGLSGNLMPFAAGNSTSSTDTFTATFNFGETDFVGVMPEGFQDYEFADADGGAQPQAMQAQAYSVPVLFDVNADAGSASDMTVKNTQKTFGGPTTCLADDAVALGEKTPAFGPVVCSLAAGGADQQLQQLLQAMAGFGGADGHAMETRYQLGMTEEGYRPYLTVASGF